MQEFYSPAINLYSRDVQKASAFYQQFGFQETFRTPRSGEPIHLELKLDGFTLGIATIETAKRDHGLAPNGEGRWIELVV